MDKLIKKKFYFVRHGKTDWNEKNLCQGQMDIPLNDEGRSEIKQLLPLISILPFIKIVTSPLRRAHETAHLIQSYRPSPIEIMDGIKERGWGIMEGAASTEMYQVEEQERNNPQYIPHITIEKRSAFKLRVLNGVNDALKTETPLIVSHGRVFLILSEIMGIEPIRQIPNTTVIECNPRKEQWQIIIHSTKGS